MMLVDETSVPIAALPVAEFKNHLRLGSGFAEDNLQDSVLESFLRAALSAVEARTSKVLIARPFSWTLHRWRNATAQPLPVAPVTEITAVTLTDHLGGMVTVASSAYWLEADSHLPCLRGSGSALPSIGQDGGVTVQFVAGFGATWADIPADLQQAVLLLAAHYYEFRQETALGSGCMPFGVTSLLARYRTMRMTAGAGQ